jgi:hypothetical protein
MRWPFPDSTIGPDHEVGSRYEDAEAKLPTVAPSQAEPRNERQLRGAKPGSWKPVRSTTKIKTPGFMSNLHLCHGLAEYHKLYACGHH